MSSFSSNQCPPSATKEEVPQSDLPLREVPGSYGVPFFSAIKDRYDYFYNQGADEFFRSRIKKYNSTIFRTNIAPGPFTADPRVVAVLDAVSYQVLFDTSKVDVRDVLVGTFTPSKDYFGGYRPCAYLDPSQPNHNLLKSLFLSTLASVHHKIIPTFQSGVYDIFTNIEDALSKDGEANFNDLNNGFAFNSLFRLLFGRYPADANLGTDGPNLTQMWIFFQLAPSLTLGLKYLPNFVEDFFLHTFQLPFFIVKSGYKKVYDAIYSSAGSILDEAEKMGIKRDEACHNLVFFAGFNGWGGMRITFPLLFDWMGLAGESLHRRLREEIRTVVKSEGGVSLGVLEKIPLTKSVVYETLRLGAPVPFQYGRAKEDMVINSHDESFKIKKGEMICGYQPLATRDPKVFVNPDEFVPDRFVGEGEKLIKYVYWSNARGTDNPAANSKQCPAKDLVMVVTRLILVEFFLRYDTFTVETGTTPTGPSVTIKSLTKAT